MKRNFTIAAVVLFLLGAQAAWAQKPSVITRLDGAAYVVRACATHDWIATWSRLANGTYDLYVVNGENGTKQRVTNERVPGGICWIPNSTRLLYCKGVYNDKVDFTRVTYYTYDVQTESSRKLIDVNDMLDTFILDPIASENGDTAFHMTIAGTPQGELPSFNVYITEAEFMSTAPAEANIASDFDLSSDGTKLYWLLHDPDTGNLFIVGWDLAKKKYSDFYEFGTTADPADDHALLKVQSTSDRAATLAASDSDPTLKLCTYNFADTNNMYIQPLHLEANEEILYFDWLGRGDVVFALLQNADTAEYFVEEINVISGSRKRLLTTGDPISYIDYSAGAKTYYYSVVDERSGSDAETALIRLK
jgi:hypothetical protein